MNVRLKHTMSFAAGVYYNQEMRMNYYTATIHMITNSNDADAHSVAFERIKYFVYNQLDSTIFINLDVEDKCQQFLEAGLSVTTLPGEPVDQLIGLMLYYKLNAIMEDRIIVEETEISSTLGENIIYLHNENENTTIPHLPNWWLTSDPMHNDCIVLDQHDKIVSIHADTVWKELNLIWSECQPNETGNIVVFRNSNFENETK